MSDKCERIDGKIDPCRDMNNALCAGWYESEGNIKADGIILPNCPFCGADIRKPEPEFIIRKSGGTWVARYDGIDYLWKGPKCYNAPLFQEKFSGSDPLSKWKPINDKDGKQVLEITDEIAFLNPLAVSDAYGLCHLIAISRNEIFIVSDINDGEWGCRTTEPRESLKRLATVSDLEES